ncbi:MAG: bifunctional aspartate kinase/homoserine dehydrogenase I [Pseudomonadota bacterium]
MSELPWQVHKFGGSSLADAQCFSRVADLMLSQPSNQRYAIVVSAMGGMTDALLGLSASAAAGDADFAPGLLALEKRYEAAAGALLDPPARGQLLDAWYRDRNDILDLLQAVVLIRSAPQRTHDVIAGYGEIWSSRLLAALLRQRIDAKRTVGWLDARDVVCVSSTRLGVSVIWPVSQQRLANTDAVQQSQVLVVTGFIASDESGLQTTLGRNGSDHSAAIFGALLNANAVTIWTDVPGVMSGDPRRIPDAKVISALSYNEAMELAYFGAKVIHPQTMGPAIAHDIPLYIRSTFAPELPGSRVSRDSTSGEPIKGITSIDGLAVINVEGSGMIGVPGTAHRLFRALRAADISVILISQASSEHSICFVVGEENADDACAVVRDAFAKEIEGGQIQSVVASASCSVIAIVGDDMSGRPGVAGRFLNTLGQAGINVIAIAQGSSERNISVVVPRADATRAIRAVHAGFYLSAKTMSIGVIGPGTVGGALLDQLNSQAERLLQDFNLDLRVRGIASSRRMLLDDKQVDLAEWRDTYPNQAGELSLETFVDHIDADHLPHAVLIDCTADDAIAEMYPQWLARGIHIITPNKKAFSGPMLRYEAMQAAARAGSSRYFYETTVGAALPIVQTLRDLRETGDTVRSVDGIFSGTLAYLFNTYDGTTAFSRIVREARDAGYTEPDPRDDLSGMDVARKLTIAARELGFSLSLDDLPVESLVPVSLRDVSVDEFLAKLDSSDAQMQERLRQARERGCVLRYIGKLDSQGKASVALMELPTDDAFANIALTDNVVRISSDRYANNPLVIQGPGAGPEVTAAGVFADLLRLAAQLGNPR